MHPYVIAQLKLFELLVRPRSSGPGSSGRRGRVTTRCHRFVIYLYMHRDDTPMLYLTVLT